MGSVFIDMFMVNYPCETDSPAAFGALARFNRTVSDR